ncbi:MAG: hypothetical protein A2Y10_06730 [Planctomycetes bacterium GWF2_41_51]|nr:MAG: hypothetical protein A2Y10_06730 [Planctomycetes bacterium GWF2_41_51]HBG29011.1 hypothetical protein [Phycisphaerales bacterium]
MTFCTAINCLDGRTQEPVVAYLKNHFKVKYVDMITEAGPVQYLADDPSGQIANSILERTELTIVRHNVVNVAIVAHYNCLGNPVCEKTQKRQLTHARDFLKKKFPKQNIQNFWVDSDWQLNIIE